MAVTLKETSSLFEIFIFEETQNPNLPKLRIYPRATSRLLDLGLTTGTETLRSHLTYRRLLLPRRRLLWNLSGLGIILKHLLNIWYTKGLARIMRTFPRWSFLHAYVVSTLSIQSERKSVTLYRVESFCWSGGAPPFQVQW